MIDGLGALALPLHLVPIGRRKYEKLATVAFQSPTVNTVAIPKSHFMEVYPYTCHVSHYVLRNPKQVTSAWGHAASWSCVAKPRLPVGREPHSVFRFCQVAMVFCSFSSLKFSPIPCHSLTLSGIITAFPSKPDCPGGHDIGKGTHPGWCT